MQYFVIFICLLFFVIFICLLSFVIFIYLLYFVIFLLSSAAELDELKEELSDEKYEREKEKESIKSLMTERTLLQQEMVSNEAKLSTAQADLSDTRHKVHLSAASFISVPSCARITSSGKQDFVDYTTHYICLEPF